MSPSFSHSQIWAALDALAERHGLSASGLARKAGLDQTTFNPSKRTSSAGRRRWPSTESVAKALAATGVEPSEFLALVAAPDQTVSRRSGRMIGLADASNGEAFDAAGRPVGPAWTELDFLADVNELCYGLKISGDAMAPLYRHGDMLIVSPHAPVRVGDRVVVKTLAGELLIAELKEEFAQAVELKPFHNGASDRLLARENVAWMSRIMWVGQ